MPSGDGVGRICESDSQDGSPIEAQRKERLKSDLEQSEPSSSQIRLGGTPHLQIERGQ